MHFIGVKLTHLSSAAPATQSSVWLVIESLSRTLND
jgi:hypothetical protein